MNNLNNLTIKQSYEYLNKKKCSSVELTSSCLEQIEKLNRTNHLIVEREKKMIELKKQIKEHKNS